MAVVIAVVEGDGEGGGGHGWYTSIDKFGRIK